MLKELEYPFDPALIIRKARSFKRILESSGNAASYKQKKIAVLGGFTTDNVIRFLELFLLNQQIKPVFFESGYNQYIQESLFPSEELLNFKPDVIYICTSFRNIKIFPSVKDDKNKIDLLLENEFNKYVELWVNLKDKFSCPIIQNNFDPPPYRLLGNKDSSDIHGRLYFINKLNDKISEYAQTHDNLFICDLNYIASDFGLSKWNDLRVWYLYKYPCAIDAIPYISFNISNIIKSIYGKNKKGLVLDLDNTLWGGVIGDDGLNGIQIGPEDAEGQAYLEFQNFLKSYQELGILLAINSKNNHDNAIVGLDKSSGVLKSRDFLAIKANWNNKDQNFIEIAKDLNLLPESLVFIDDNPVERQIINSSLPEVCAPDIGDVANYIKSIDRNGYFEATVISSDDLIRNQMYQENAQRAQYQSNFKNYKEFLISLDMHAQIIPFESIYYERIAQLSNKSNQFNLTTKRYSVEDIKSIALDDQSITLLGKLVDKFGDNGVVSIIIGQVLHNDCHIRLWIMSCRVLKRDMEYAMSDMLVEVCKKNNIKYIYGYYYPTEKNSIVKDLYKDLGYELHSKDDQGNTIWRLDLSSYKNLNSTIDIEA